MYKIIFTFIILFVSILFGLQLTENPGYFFISYEDWTIESPLWFSILAIIGLFVIFHVSLLLLRFFRELPARISFWARSRRMKASWNKTSKGLVAFNEGRWKEAEKELLKAVDNEEVSVINYLTAAQSAQAQGREDKRDKYLLLAQQNSDKSDISIVLTQAKLQISQGEYKQALLTLQGLLKKYPKQSYLLSLLKTVYEKVEDWDNLLKLIPQLVKCHLLKRSEKINLEHKAYLSILSGINSKGVKNNDREKAFNKLWQKIPNYLKIKAPFICEKVKFLINSNKNNEAEKIIYRQMKHESSDHLITIYSQIESDNVDKQLKAAEKWLKKIPNNPSLYLTLARLSQKTKLWGKARTYYKESLRLAPDAVVYAEFGDLLKQLGETELALTKYREGLTLIENNTCHSCGE